MRSNPAFLLRLLAIALSLVLAAGGAVFYASYLRPVASAVQQTTGVIVPRPALTSQTGPLAPAEPAAAAPSPDAKRLNILLLGSDTDAKFGGVYDTQIMIVVTVDPAQGHASMLSIPRDLWVPIPGFGMGKIGTAYHDGGIALARETVERDLNIPIDYYAWIGLDGFVKVVDTFGGVDVDVLHPIVDDSYPDDLNDGDPYAYRRLYIPAGPQHLDGTTALEYVRSRHGDLVGDFGRSDRQQQVLNAIRARAGAGTIAAHLPELATDLAGSLRTDMSLIDLARLARTADTLKGSGIHQYVLSPPTYSSDGWSADGQSIVVPKWTAIQALIGTMLA